MFVEKTLQIGIAIVRGGAERVAELGIGIGHKNREIILAVDVDVERSIVGDEFGKQREDEQDEKYPKRVVAATIGLEVAPAARIERREFEAARQGSDAHRSSRLDVRPQLLARQRALWQSDLLFGFEFDVHLTPLASRSRCGDRSRCR